MQLLTKSTWSDPKFPGIEFEIRPLTYRETLAFNSIARSKGAESDDASLYLFEKGLAGWRGIEESPGTPAEATPENAMQLPFKLGNSLARRISVLSGLLPDPDAEKNSPSQSQSSGSAATSTAETADGAATADPTTPPVIPSGS